MSPTLQYLGTTLFALAVLHTFAASSLKRFSHRFAKGSGRESLFHLLGEVEVVFGFWAAILMLCFGWMEGPKKAIQYQESLNFAEPIFVFCIMIVAATRPILHVVRGSIQFLGALLARLFAVPAVLADFFVVLAVGPLCGSLITEPAAMTVTALLLVSLLRRPKRKLIYFLLGTLFVNVSIGGALTPFAAPPILMVAGKWGWDFHFVFSYLGWKSALAVLLNAFLFVLLSAKSLKESGGDLRASSSHQELIPIWVCVLHFLVLAGLVLTAHHASVTLGLFLLFLGVTTVTKRYQSSLRIREALLVAFFLAGLVMFGAFQKWWLEPLLSKIQETTLFFVATGLTAITDNAALTYLGSQVDLSDPSKYFLVAGAIAGGGLTIIANAPNVTGYSVLQHLLPNGLNALWLFLGALLPTIVAAACLGWG